MKKLNSKGFSPLEALVILAVIAVIGLVSYSLYHSKVAHAGSWTALSLEPNNNALDLSGISGQACSIHNPAAYTVQVEVTDTNPNQTDVLYETYASPSSQNPLSYQAKETYTTGINQDVNMTIAENGYFTVKVTTPTSVIDSGFFYNPEVNLAATNNNIVPGSPASAYINPATLTDCPGDNSANINTANLTPTVDSATHGYLVKVVKFVKRLI